MLRKRKGNAQLYAMLAPNFVLFLIMSVYPIIWAFRYMFFFYDGVISKPVFIGMNNFIRVFTRDVDFWQSALNTLVYAGGKIVIVLPLAFIVAVILNKKTRYSGTLQAIIFSPTILSAAVMSLVFYLLFNAYNGDINRALKSAGLIHTSVNWLGAGMAMLTIIIVAVWGGLGNYMVYFLAGLQQVPTELYESSELDGANVLQKNWYITLPMLGPVLKIIIMLAIINAFQDIQSIMVLTGGGPFNKTMVMTLYIYQLFFPINADGGGGVGSQYGYGAAVSIVAAVICGIITVIYLRMSRRMDDI